jgi:hypothetical protein
LLSVKKNKIIHKEEPNMVHWGWLVLAFMVGGTIGTFMMGLVAANKVGDEYE